MFSTAEYNQSLPGGLKNMLDWVSRCEPSPLAGKPCAIMGATVGGWGTRIAQQQLATVLWSCGARVLDQRLYHARAATAQIEPSSMEIFALSCIRDVEGD